MVICAGARGSSFLFILHLALQAVGFAVQCAGTKVSLWLTVRVVAASPASGIVSCRKRRDTSFMHELSIASSIVEAVTESAAAYPGARVKEVRLRVGALASVVEDSLQFCWELATEGSPLAGSKLVINVLPVIVHCEPAGRTPQLAGVQSFRCPHCGEIGRRFPPGPRTGD